MDFTREGKRLDNSTTMRMISLITCFLGFCHRFKQVALPTLECCYNVSLFLAYLSFLIWKGAAQHTYQKLFTAICTVCRWFQSQTEDSVTRQVGSSYTIMTQ